MMDEQDIRKFFNETAQNSVPDDLRSTLRQLGDTIGALRKAGLDVELSHRVFGKAEVFSTIGENIKEKRGGFYPLHLRLNDQIFPASLFSRGDADMNPLPSALAVCLLDLDYINFFPAEASKGTAYARVFTLEDEDAFSSLQSFIIYRVAASASINSLLHENAEDGVKRGTEAALQTSGTLKLQKKPLDM